MSGDSITILALWLRKLSSLGISKISMFRPLEKIRQYSDSGINFQRISTKLKFEPCESIRYLLSTNSFGFGTLRPRLYGEKLSRVEGSPTLPSQLLTTVYMSKVVPVDRVKVNPTKLFIGPA